MKPILVFTITLLLALAISACSERDDTAKGSSQMSSGMKCGAGKCGANMFDGNAALSKKKKNILSQMREDDPRKDCVIKAKTTKATYNCVRDPKTSKLTMKCGNEMQMPKEGSGMKCGAGKCGSAMEKPEPKPTMKCGAGKCGSSM